MKTLMIDYMDTYTGKIVRCRIDGCAFSIRDGICYFTSNGEDVEVDVNNIFQVYPN